MTGVVTAVAAKALLWDAICVAADRMGGRCWTTYLVRLAKVCVL